MAPTFVLTDVRVLDGERLLDIGDVAVVDGLVADAAPAGAPTVPGHGGTLLPGLIDTHVHVGSEHQLRAYGRWGVTTVIDMGTADWPTTTGLRNRPGLADLRSAGAVACAVRGRAVRSMNYPATSAVTGPDDAARFVGDRVADGVDHVKIVLEERLPFRPKPLDAPTVAALVAAAHDAGLLVCVHATSAASFAVASEAGADVLTHAPLSAALSQAQADAMATRDQAVSPTLVMMEKLIERFPAPIKPRRITYANVEDSVRALHRAGVPILVGTDANSDPTAPNTIEHGAAVHHELELLVRAGLTPAQALLGATRTAARVFGLADRGRIRAGMRADLLLVDGDPTEDIATTNRILGVWIAGREVR